MAIDLSNILSIYAGKVSSLDSNTPLSQMVTTIQRYVEFGGKITASYDSVVDLPYDSALQGMIVSVGGVLRNFNGNNWDMLDSDTIVDPIPWSVQGDLYGYITGGIPSTYNIDKYPFAAAGTVSIGTTAYATSFATGSIYSETTGYIAGGTDPLNVSYLQTFSFVSDGNGISLGDMGEWRGVAAGATSGENGYTMGAHYNRPGTVQQQIAKFPFAATTGAVTVSGLLTSSRYYNVGTSSLVDGYSSGGLPSGSNVVEKFPFAAEGNASDVGDLTWATQRAAGLSSETDMYIGGGGIPTTNYKNKISFASGGNGVSVGNMKTAAYELSASNSRTDGYIHNPLAPAYIQRFPFASDTDIEADHGGSNNGYQTVGHSA